MDFGRAVYEVARKDVLQHIRTKRLLIIGIFFVVVLQIVTMVFPLAFGDMEDPAPGEPSLENTLFFFHLNASLFGGLFAIQLLCIVLTADAVCSEWSQRTIFLLLSKPVSRTAFVVGKYIGSIVSIIPTIAALYVLQYFLMMMVYPGQPTGDEVIGFILMLGMLALGAMAVASVALFFSSLTRSNVLSLILTLLVTFFLFPILSAIGDIQFGVDQSKAFQNGGDGDTLDPEDWKYDWSHYITPSGTLSAAPGLLMPHQNGDDFGFSLSLFIPQFAPHRTWLAVLSGLGFTALLVGLSIVRVNKRNFE
ncbi:MAG: family transporter protein [Thermoplasmata archaeon]|jgi:ABC-type transport system involved in multi-copper enzyme maturation permease subunit|nr:family transporter protein [Thermoplasmata archaeon]MEA3165256.1 family transporter protein [Thermoplasmata archaeon]